jgi:hypothetical protein
MDQDGGGPQESGKGVLLAVAILLLWLAGVCLWVAFEGAAVLPVALPAGPGGKPSHLLGLLQSFTAQVQQLQDAGIQAQAQPKAKQQGG